MQRVSFKTLVLMLLLLAAVVAHQQIQCTPVASASVVWMETDPSDANEPGPECWLQDAEWIWLDVQDVNDPNEPMPEATGWLPIYGSPVEDPNEPGPEYA